MHPRLRQVVLLTNDLDSALAEARELFGFTGGVRDPQGMADLGFEHEVLTFTDTCLEIIAPLDPESSFSKLAASGVGGYMTVVQVPNLNEFIERAEKREIRPVMHVDYEGQDLSQWHPKDVGTLAEFDQIEPPESWHFAPGVFEHQATGVATNIAGVTLSVKDPAKMAEQWGYLTNQPHEQTSIMLADGPVTFIPFDDGPRGLRVVELFAADPARVGEVMTLCGVEFRLVAPKGELV
ncbi:MAG: VOC family protein [Leucobacter sp.]|jgi:hypothetical protein|nr:VOC family protein [Leucobacter sp.]